MEEWEIKDTEMICFRVFFTQLSMVKSSAETITNQLENWIHDTTHKDHRHWSRLRLLR